MDCASAHFTDLRRKGTCGRFVGVDEVGRGAAAGPVVAAAAALRAGRTPADVPPALRDSKTMSRRQRDRVAAALPDVFHLALGARGARRIDADGIRPMTLAAMTDALRRLHAIQDPTPWQGVVVDGTEVPPSMPWPALAIPKADASVIEVAAAAVWAKIARDRLMAIVSRRHAGFDWDRNAGYLTPAHLRALRASGPTPHHRTTFIRKALQFS